MSEKIKVEIGGVEYVLSSDRDEEYMQSLARGISKKLDDMLKQNPYLSTTMAALLIALDCKDNEQKAYEAVEDAKS
jgi:cell division protein ZapA (FtsZ GTPase activity inhibitor)